MRGKKIDYEFLCSFISKNVSAGKLSSSEILEEAKQQIEDIDNKIKEVESLKKIRSKLLDVVSTFDNKKSNIESEILSLFKIKNTEICYYICSNLDKSFNELLQHNFLKSEIISTYQKLIEFDVIKNHNNIIVKGKYYDEYLKYVLNYGNR